MHPDPRTVLGVAPEAGRDEIRSAYRELARRLHPDHAGGDGEALARVNMAYATLMAAAQREPRPPASAAGAIRLSFSFELRLGRRRRR
jgi:curved DNA-binding protein CbpA